MSLSSQQNKTLLTGHEGAGSDCLGKTIDYGWKGLLIGGLRKAIKRYRLGYHVTVLCSGGISCAPLVPPGGSVGTVEGCFINPVPGSTTPMLVRALGLIVGRAALGGGCVHVYHSQLW